MLTSMQVVETTELPGAIGVNSTSAAVSTNPITAVAGTAAGRIYWLDGHTL
jgi:hypothetical protein